MPNLVQILCSESSVDLGNLIIFIKSVTLVHHCLHLRRMKETRATVIIVRVPSIKIPLFFVQSRPERARHRI